MVSPKVSGSAKGGFGPVAMQRGRRGGSETLAAMLWIPGCKSVDPSSGKLVVCSRLSRGYPWEVDMVRSI